MAAALQKCEKSGFSRPPDVAPQPRSVQKYTRQGHSPEWLARCSFPCSMMNLRIIHLPGDLRFWYSFLIRFLLFFLPLLSRIHDCHNRFPDLLIEAINDIESDFTAAEFEFFWGGRE